MISNFGNGGLALRARDPPNVLRVPNPREYMPSTED